MPSGAPSTPLIVGKSPHSLSLEWQPPSPHKQNGRVRYYNLVLTEIDTGNLLRFASNTTTTEVESLHPFYHYACRVQAVTTAPGPLSFEITVQLPESSMYNTLHGCIATSNKKHFMKNVKECRDVNCQKSIRTRSGCYRHTSHTLWTHSVVRIVRAL